ncbi:hypothetical protein GRJ2_001098700 [Grus japonensis]|uniref:Uncharacterized protein n=1 Tax=Grus japonensis TaxID=30415 RepID=A0ABC9WLL8_GRUJA
MSNDDVLPKWQGMESSACLMLNGHCECNSVKRPYDTAEESVIICTLQAKTVVSPILFSNDLSEYRDTLSRENDDATMKRYLPEQPPNYELQSIPEAVLDSAKILQSTKILISPKPVIPTRCNGYRGFL